MALDQSDVVGPHSGSGVNMAIFNFFKPRGWAPGHQGYSDWLDIFADPSRFTTVSATATSWTVRAADPSTYGTGDYVIFPAAGSSFTYPPGSAFPSGVIGRIELRDASTGQLAFSIAELGGLGLQVSALQTRPTPLLNGNDTFHGSSGQDTFTAGAGDDVLHGSSQGDLFGDALLGGDGNDVLYGGPAGDSLSGGAGDDLIYVGQQGAFDRASGDEGNDVIRDGSGEAFGGEGDDLIVNVGGWLYGEDGNDTLEGSGRLFGGSGDDRLTGSVSSDTLDAGTGRDVVVAGGGDDTIVIDGLLDFVLAGEGNDQVRVIASTGQAGYDHLVVEGGLRTDQSHDRIVFDRAGPAVNVQVGGGGGAGVFVRGFDSIELSNRADRLEVTATTPGHGQSIEGHGGDDIILGGDEWDSAYGGDGDDFLDGRIGDDRLTGGSGDDVLLGAAGDDFLSNDAGDDLLDGGSGSDTVTFYTQEAGDPLILDLALTTAQFTGAGWDTLLSIENVEFWTGYFPRQMTILGNESANRLLANGEGARLEGRGGDDVLTAHYCYGDEGDDELIGREVYGGAGDDILQSRKADGGTGIDLLRVTLGFTNEDIVFDAEAGSLSTPPDYYGNVTSMEWVNVERFNVFGFYGNDTLRGGAYGDDLSGNRGDDLIEGRGGDDVLWGAEGTDILRGGDGDDLVHEGQGDDIYEGGAGRDTLRLWGPGYVEGLGMVGVTVDLAVTDARQWTGQGNDLISGFENLIGTIEANDVLKGDGGDNSLWGESGDDVLIGRSGHDTLYGGDGFDTAVFSGSSKDYKIFLHNDQVRVKGADGSDLLIGIERLRFDDGDIEVHGPLVLPATPTVSKPEQPLVLPDAQDQGIKDGGALVLPADAWLI